MKKSTLFFYITITFSSNLLPQSEIVFDKFQAFSFDGVSIYYTKSESEDKKPVLIFIHCWSCDKSYWQTTIEYFNHKYTTIAIDLAGHGDSGLGREDWTIENYAKDVEAVAEQENFDNIILVGHSMGGSVALYAAQLLGEKVKALIAIDTFHDIEEAVTPEQFNNFYEMFEADFPGTTKEFVEGLFAENADSILVKKISMDMSSAKPDIALASFRSLFRFDESTNFDKINIPVRFINSDKFPTNVEAAKRHIKDFDIKIINGVGHFPMFEKPEEFSKLLQETLMELEKNND